MVVPSYSLRLSVNQASARARVSVDTTTLIPGSPASPERCKFVSLWLIQTQVQAIASSILVPFLKLLSHAGNGPVWGGKDGDR